MSRGRFGDGSELEIISANCVDTQRLTGLSQSQFSRPALLVPVESRFVLMAASMGCRLCR